MTAANRIAPASENGKPHAKRTTVLAYDSDKLDKLCRLFGQQQATVFAHLGSSVLTGQANELLASLIDLEVINED